MANLKSAQSNRGLRTLRLGITVGLAMLLVVVLPCGLRGVTPALADPGILADVANGDYHLQVGSSCIDAGTPIGAPAHDIKGTSRDAVPDMGAYEWTGSRVYLPLALRNHSVEARWSVNMQVNDDAGTAWNNEPRIAVDGFGNVYTVWMDYRDDPDGRCDNTSCNPYIYSSRWLERAWSSNIKGPGTVGLSLYVPGFAFAVDTSGNAYAVWVDTRNGNSDIYFSHRPTGGNWATNVKINDDIGTASQWSPRIAMDTSGNVYVV